MLVRLRYGVAQWAVLLVCLGYIFTAQVAIGQITACIADVDIHTVSPNSTYNPSFQVTNNDDDTVVSWIKITVPDGNYHITAATATDWTTTPADNFAEITGNNLAPHDSISIQLTTDVTAVSPAANWNVEVSESSTGIEPTACSGNLTSTISDSTVPPVISDIFLTDLSTTAVTVNWATDEPATTQVVYGLTTGYGQASGLDSELTTDHSVQISGLTANSGYHFKVKSEDADNNVSESSDNTFLTPAVVTTTPTIVVVPDATLTETEPPSIQLTNVPTAVQKTAPPFTGIATDNVGVARVDYSTDGGINWLPADANEALGSKSINFSFTPLIQEDGDYEVMARAVDFSNNIATSSAVTLVIDRLPPQVGGGLLSIGPQILYPDEQGVIRALVGVDEKITLSAIGGATSVTLEAKLQGKNVASRFFMAQSEDSGLWSGIISFAEAGQYELSVVSIDGADNTTDRSLGTLLVLPATTVVSLRDKQPITDGEATLYYRDPDTQAWVVWDGAAYGQTNPQQLDDTGTIRLLAPAGVYYLKINARGFRPLISEILRLSKTTAFVSVLELSPQWSLNLGFADLRLPNWQTTAIDLNGEQTTTENTLSSTLINSKFPKFDLSTTEGSTLKTLNLSGRPTLVSMLNTWAPSSSDQLASLAELQNNPDINIVPIFTHERSLRVNAFLQTAHSTMWAVGDPDGTLVESLHFSTVTVPTHYFVDRKGNIKKIMFGVLSKEQISNELGGL